MHHQVLICVFLIAVAMWAVVNKTPLFTMGAVSDCVNIGRHGPHACVAVGDECRRRGRRTAARVAGMARISGEAFPVYRTANFAWLRYVLSSLSFGSGATLASGCGNKTLVRLGGGELRSFVVP